MLAGTENFSYAPIKVGTAHILHGLSAPPAQQLFQQLFQRHAVRVNGANEVGIIDEDWWGTCLPSKHWVVSKHAPLPPTIPKTVSLCGIDLCLFPN